MTIYNKCENPYVDKNGIAYGCGQCASCRKNKSLEWCIRARHELITNKKALFMTLTYCDKKLHREALIPENNKDELGVLKHEDVQLFLKRLRKKYCLKLKKRRKKYDWKNWNFINQLTFMTRGIQKYGKVLSYLMCGEYGPETHRPHYHFILWGLNYDETSRKKLKKLWRMGNVDLSKEYVTDFCVSYVVGYIQKKLKYKDAEKSYKNNNRTPPYLRASQGIGRKWCLKNIDDWTKTLSIGYNRNQFPVPRYYIKIVKKMEGRTIRYVIHKTTHEGNEVNEYGYKIIENPDGYYTNRINIVMKKNKMHDMKKWGEKYNIGYIEDVIDFYNKDQEQREIDRILIWELTKGMTDYALENILERDIDARVKTIDKLHKKIFPTHGKHVQILKDNDMKRLNKNARQKNWDFDHGLYGKRDLIEYSEKLLDSNKNN